MTGHLAYEAARANIDDFHRKAAAQRLAADALGRPRRRLSFSVHRDRIGAPPTRDRMLRARRAPVAELPTIARH
jgi:hypothetical protein